MNTTSLDPGTYNATITFTSPKTDNRQQYVTVDYEIFEGPARVEVRYYPTDWIYTQDSTLSVEIWVQSAEDISASQLGFKLSRNLFRIDTAYWGPEMNIDISVLRWYTDSLIGVDSIWTFFSPGGISGFPPEYEPMFEATSDPVLMATVEMTFKEDSINNLPALFFCDSTWFPPAGEFILTTNTANSVYPEFVNDTIYLKYFQYQPTHIHLNPTHLEFNALYTGDLPVSQSFQITNQASGVLDWSIADNADWLDEWPLSGQSSSEEITVNVNTTSLNPGEHNALITVTGYNADNSPQYVNVDYNLYPCGDANCDLTTNFSDAVYIISVR